MDHIGKLWFRAEPSDDGTVLRVEWVPAPVSNYGVGGGMPTDMLGLQIGIFPLNAVDRAAARVVLRRVALPELDSWICDALQASESWLQVRHGRCWRLTDSRLTHHEQR
jgi:hypothetical protein